MASRSSNKKAVTVSQKPSSLLRDASTSFPTSSPKCSRSERSSRAASTSLMANLLAICRLSSFACCPSLRAATLPLPASTLALDEASGLPNGSAAR